MNPKCHNRLKAATGILLWLMSSPIVVAQGAQSGEIRSHYERAQSDLQANRPGDAALEFQAILRLDPNNAEAHATTTGSCKILENEGPCNERRRK